jgi:NADH:ubiquinone oxidoreductase subunit 2 (subunit N)
LVTILSFAGIPPLFGFSIKLVLFLLIINSTALFYVLILAVFNFFTLYFYIQNVRYVVNNSPNNYYVYVNNFVLMSDTSMFFSMLFGLINITGILYLGDLSIFFNTLNFN